MSGRLRDQGMQALLKELARAGSDWGLCVISTRLSIEDIKGIKAVKEVWLENLSPEAGAKLLHKLGVTKGTDAELQQANTEFDGHALALTLLGRYLAVVHNGEIRKRDLVPALQAEEEKGGHAKRVVKSYEIWLKDKPELDILYLMGLFDRPADEEAIKVLRKKPVIPGLTDNIWKLDNPKWRYAVQHLRDLRLLDKGDINTPSTLDCHPLIREHFGEELKTNEPSAWKEAHRRLYFHFRSIAKLLPDTLSEMEPLYRAIAHGCQAGRHQEALDDIYCTRIQRNSRESHKNYDYALITLNAFGANLTALYNYYEAPWSTLLNTITENSKGIVANQAGLCLMQLCRFRESLQSMKLSLDIVLAEGSLNQIASAAANVSMVYLWLGDLDQSVHYANMGVDFADRSEDKFNQSANRAVLAHTFCQLGNFILAEELFNKAEQLQSIVYPHLSLLYALPGFNFCDLLLCKRDYLQILKRASYSLKLSLDRDWHLYTALSHLSLAKATLFKAKYSILAKNYEPGLSGIDYELLDEALGYFNQSAHGLRTSGNMGYLPLSLLSRAEFYCVTHDFPAAWQDLTEAKEIAERGEMRLHLADFHLEAARLFHAAATAAANGEYTDAITAFLADLPEELKTQAATQPPATFALNKAQFHLATAKTMVEQMGYGRRKPEIAALEEALSSK